MKPTRVFDCIDHQLQYHPMEEMFAAKEGGKWRKYSTQQVKEIVDSLCAGFLEMGIGGNDMSIDGRDKVAILSKNRPEWLFVDLAVQKIGAVLIPVYPTVHVGDLEFVLNDAAVKMVFVNDEELFLKVQSVRSKTPTVTDVFSFEHVSGARHWKELLHSTDESSLSKINEIAASIKPEDLFTIIYTSGTTGTPKGVMLSHHNLMSNVLSTIDCVFNDLGISGHKALSFLPLNHIFERMVSYIYIYSGTSIYYAEDLDKIGENLKEVQPHTFTTVPRLLEKVFEKIMAKGNDLTGIKRKLFFWALDLAGKFELEKNHGAWYNLQLAIANKLIFSKWREALGGNIKCIVTGAAACQVKLIRLFTAANIPILEAYGLTESSPAITANRLNPAFRKFGTVGLTIDGVEVKIAEDGEILCKGPNVMMGYYKRPDLTAETVVDGWLHTGDIGTIIDGTFLKITDRKKEIFKTSGGKYVAPQPIENKLSESPLIEQIMVIGADQKFTAALIVPSYANLKKWCSQKGFACENHSDMVNNEKVLDHYREEVESFNKNFNHVEQVKKFELLPHEWTVAGGELTPTFKLKRKVIMEKYRDSVERIYAS